MQINSDTYINNKQIIITGATGGIGSATIHHLISIFPKIKIFMVSSNKYDSTTSNMNTIAQEIYTKYPQNIVGYLGIDMKIENAAKIIMNHACSAFAGEVINTIYDFNKPNIISSKNNKDYAPDILINTTGISKDNFFMRINRDEWSQQMQINLNSTWELTQLSLYYMMQKKWGRIVSISSIVGKIGNPGQTVYAASKAAIDGMTKSLAVEVAKYGITVNSIQPGFIDTNMTYYLKHDSKKAIMDSIISKIPMQRLGEPHDVALGIEYLIKSSYVTGTSLEISGGMCRF